MKIPNSSFYFYRFVIIDKTPMKAPRHVIILRTIVLTLLKYSNLNLLSILFIENLYARISIFLHY